MTDETELSSLPEREDRTGSDRFRRTGLFATAVIVFALLLAPTPVPAQDWLLIEGIFDGQLSDTDPDSRRLSHNGGDVAPAGQLLIWTVAQVTAGLQFYVLTEAEAEGTVDGSETEFEFEQVALRYTVPSGHTQIEAGKLLTPIGGFAKRRLSTTNPLIGRPDSYNVSYPLGVQVSGLLSKVDYVAALVDKPLVNDRYVPEPDPALRPALAAGVTISTGFRLGSYYTWGPYLNRDVGSLLPPGTGWKAPEQRVLGFEAEFSRGHLELYGELILSSYEVPTHTSTVDGTAYYLEVKYTWSPRFFTAIRFEQNDYAFIRAKAGSAWVAKTVEFHDTEAGVGYRLSPRTLLKVSYRADRWAGRSDLNGHALAAQISYRFDVRSWFERKR